jgi:hypothetical protein
MKSWEIDVGSKDFCAFRSLLVPLTYRVILATGLESIKIDREF